MLTLLACLVPLSAAAADLVSTNGTWKYFKGISEASSPDPAAWRAIGFDDSGWATGAAPFYYDSDTTATGYTGNTLLGDMRGGYTCIFMRRAFVVANPADISEFQFGALSDDGFIAWINGAEVARFNMPAGDIPFNGTASPALAEPVPFQNETLAGPSAYLVPGTNVLAVQAFNASISNSSDFVIEVSLGALLDTTPPTVSTLIPATGATVRTLTSIEVDFSEPVTGVDAADLWIGGSPATNVTAFAPWQYVFQFSQPPTGTIQVGWAPNHGIQDLAGTPNPFAGGSWTYRLDPAAPAPGVQISEFMADNKNGIHDEDGDSSDWIELFNSGSVDVNLQGWALSDDPRDLMEWRFPALTLPANGYALVFASGKDRTNVTGRLHTNFQLATGGEFLALVDPATNIVSAFTPLYPAQQPDVSYGRDPVSPEILGYFTVPTPGAPNATVGPGFSPAVNFAQDGGTFINPFQLELYLPAGAVAADIRYTLDGSAPTAASTLYAGPITVTNTVQVRARAFAAGLLPGPLHSETYLLLNANVINLTSDLPAIVIHNFGAGTVPVSTPQLVNMSFYEPGGGRTSLTNAPTLSTRAGIRVRGSSTQGLPKQSWSVEFWDEFNNDRKHAPLGLPEESDWVLYAPNNFEPVLIHNPFIYQLSNEIGRYAPRTRFVEVYLNTTGGAIASAQYNGIYVLEEKIKTGPDRVDIDALQAEDTAAPAVTGGYMMKIDRLDPGDNGFGAAGQVIAYVDPKEADINTAQRAPQRQYINNYMNAFGTALNGANYKDPVAGYRAYADTGAWIDHHILNVMAFNVDALRLSAYFYKERSGKLLFGPIWDFDRSQGSTDGRDFNPKVWRSTVGDLGTDFFNYPWWGRMFTDIDFWQAWIDRYQDLRTGLLSTNHINADIDLFSDQVRAEQPREANRWSTLSTRPRSGTVSSAGYTYTFPGSYQGEINFMKQWYRDRLAFMDGNFLARPVLGSPGGPITPGFALTLAGPAGATLYFTTDGTDPRLSGGGVAPGARPYSSPITLNANARVVARSWDAGHTNLTGANKPPLSSPWSGPAAATFVVATPALAITEIMYHPAPPPAGSTNVADDFEYLELKNVGASALNLVGVHFTNGIDYTFTAASAITTLAAGQSVLLVKNRAAFTARYPGAGNIAGEYLGSLDNSGERLSLVGALLEPILDFRYENSWYPVTDGPGFSLVVRDDQVPFSSWGDPARWRPSARPGGSPGTDDSVPAMVAPVRINEALTHTDPPQVDSIELYNPTAQTVNLGGWFLTDDFRAPKKYRLPGTASISPGEYLVIGEGEFNNGSATSFALSSLGDEVYLFSGDAATNLTGYVHGFKFGAAQNGVSFGRYVTSTGAEHFVAQAANSLGATNTGPRIGPIVISEIMFDPPPVTGTNNNTRDEFIELHNGTGLPAPLYDPNFPTNTWRLGGGVEFAFPMNLTLPPDGYLLVVNFDPVHQPALLADFQAKYATPPNALIVGPLSGALDNQGEAVELLKPDPPQTSASPNPGFVPYILVDRVEYGILPPWPTNTVATGLSLQRIDAGAYGDDPVNWRAAPPTAASLNAGAVPLDSDGDGLPDAWESAHGLDPRDAAGDNGASGDPDGDGFTNWQEFISGTDPHNATSYLEVTSIDASAGSARVRFNAVAGRTYTVLYRDDVDAGPWQPLASVPAQPADGPVEVLDPDAGATLHRFYRLVTPQVP